jgi:hypothetical protein
MLYQLPNGKVIELDIDDILNMDQHTIQLFIACDAGIHATHPFYKSNVDNVTKADKLSEEDLENDDPKFYYRDYFPDDYEEDDDPLNSNTDII